MSEQQATVIKLVVFSQGGDRCHCTNQTTRAGYGTPEKPHATEGQTIPDGTPVIDNRAAVDTDAGFGWVFAGPMLDVDLPDGEVNACPMPSPEMAAGLQGSFGTLAALHVAARAEKTPTGPLDMVGVSRFVQGWREHGARIGHYENNVIVWED